MLPKSWLNQIDIDKLSAHNLAARVLANTVCPEFDILEKDEYGKPYFESAHFKISLTHAGKYAGFMQKESDDCGLDMEQITDRVRRIVTKFVREDENEFLQHDLQGMYLLWCAKEALYKYYGLKSLDFKEHMKVEYQPLKSNGSLFGHIQKGDYNKQVHFDYQFFEEYLLVHTN
ncbi:MAG: hypothetical protein RLZZ337_1475 [Bacteroidota bacterium]